MVAHEFQSDVRSDGTLQVPQDIARQLPPGTTVRVLILVAQSDEARDWQNLATEQFRKGYADEDSIDDRLSVG